MYPTKVINIDTGIAHDGRLKKDRYGWQGVEGKVEPVFLDIKSLNVDTYQRGEVSKQKTIEKARSFSYEAAGACIVAQRGDGSFWIVDGLQRILALIKRGDTEKTWGMVFQSRGKSHESSVFYLCNVGRSLVPAIHKYKVAVASGFSPQVEMDEWLTENGLTVANHQSKGTIQFVSSLQQGWAISPEATKKAILFATAVGEGFPEGHVFKGAITLSKRGVDIENYVDKALSMGGNARIKQKIHEIAILTGAGKSLLVCARGLVDVLNHKVRSHRIVVDLGGMDGGG